MQIQNNAKKHDNNVASAHCVNNSEERKIANAHKVFAESVQKEKPLVIRNDNHNNAEKHDNNATLVHCMQSQKDAKKHDNNVAFALRPVWETPCVNNVAFVHCVQIQNFDSLSRKIKNPCSVINNFKLKEDISLWNIKKNF